MRELATFYRELSSESETLSFGTQLSKLCPTHFVIFLHGELGSGKTTLVRGFLRGLGYEGIVKSPTYTLVEPYELAGHHIFHFDLYRLKKPQELENIGIRDYFSPPSICLIEWPERAANLLPIPDLTCNICPSQQGRSIQIDAPTKCGQNILGKLK